MSASGKLTLRRSARLYLAEAGAFALFGAVYEYFSHGVYSPFMAFAFVFPLLGAAALFALSSAPGAHFPPRAERDLLCAGTGTLAVGSALRGVFEIYGTAVAAVNVYWLAGAALCAAAALLYFLGPGEKREREKT